MRIISKFGIFYDLLKLYAFIKRQGTLFWYNKLLFAAWRSLGHRIKFKLVEAVLSLYVAHGFRVGILMIAPSVDILKLNSKKACYTTFQDVTVRPCQLLDKILTTASGRRILLDERWARC